MKIILSVFFFICVSCNQHQEESYLSLSGNICSYYGEEVFSKVSAFGSSNEAEKIIQLIVNKVGLKPNFEVRAADVPNAAAVVSQSKRFILYNPQFVSELEKRSGTSWVAVSILAHEVGHHLNGHTLTNSGSRPDLELEADEFSGFVLKKLGATLSEAQSAMNIAASIKASHTHPAKKARLIAIETGWNNADEGSQKNSATITNRNIEKPASVKNPKTSDYEVLAEKYIAFDVTFNSESNIQYYVTIKNHLVKIVNNKIVIVGNMSQANKSKYAAMIYDNFYNYIYITSTGNIVNGNDKLIGTIKKHS